jgi:UDP:flavonoid glycosyltransferase YjiC (YdhE family)
VRPQRAPTTLTGWSAQAESSRSRAQRSSRRRRIQSANARRVADVGAGIALDGDRGPARRMLDGPGPDVLAALPGAVETVLGDPGHRRAADAIARSIDALPPVDAAVGVLRTIVGRG